MNTVVAIAGPAGTPRSALGYTLISARWELQLGSITAETGSDAGSDLIIIPYNDAGIAKAPVLTIQRATGTLSLSTQPNIPGYATTAYVDSSVNNAIIVAEQHATPVGSVSMYGGAAAPANWLLCNGASVSTVTYAALFAVLGYTYGGSGANFNLPNMQGRFPCGVGTGYGLGTSGGAATVTLDGTMIAPHAHLIEQTPHVHGYTDPTHKHTVSDPTHTHTGGIGTHTHASVGVGGYGAISAGIGIAPGTGGAGSTDLDTLQTGAGSGAISINPAATNISVNFNGVGITISGAYANINNNATDNSGGGQPHENRPPYLTMNFIIKYQ